MRYHHDFIVLHVIKEVARTMFPHEYEVDEIKLSRKKWDIPAIKISRLG